MSKRDSTDLTVDRLRTLIHYNPETGVFTRLVKTANCTKVGERIGVSLSETQAAQIRVNWTPYPAPKLAWFYVHGVWPPGQVAFVNGDARDTRLSNIALRSDVTRAKRSRRVTHEELKSLVSYDPLTGLFHWLVDRSNVKAGKGFKAQNHGYVLIYINKKAYPAHRLAWFYVHGSWPPSDKEIDHINRVRDDNRLANLRLATRAENCQNTTRPVTNKSGVKGVYMCPHTGRWMAYINVDKRMLYLGRYTDLHTAEAVRKKAEDKYHPFAAK